jgi:hypothetical protein
MIFIEEALLLAAAAIAANFFSKNVGATSYSERHSASKQQYCCSSKLQYCCSSKLLKSSNILLLSRAAMLSSIGHS